MVTSDRQVQAEARAVQAEILSSETFAALLKEARSSMPKPDKEQKISQEEIEEWMRLFQKGKPREW